MLRHLRIRQTATTHLRGAPRGDKYLKTIPDRGHSNELLFLPSCVDAHIKRSFFRGQGLWLKEAGRFDLPLL
jgi:hypothetical protein